MLQAIDQWAFQVLFALYGLLGIQDIPREPSPDWKVIERWTEQPDKTYRLVIESESVAKICQANPNISIIFPQTYMARQEIFVDGQLVYSNSLSEKWNLSSVFNRPVLSCRAVSGAAKKILFVVDANINFFLGISSYPVLRSYYPIYSFFYDSIYLAAAAICVSLGIIGAVLMRKLGSSDSIFIIVLRDTLLALLMISYVPGYFLDANINFFHYSMGITLSCGFLFLIKPIFFETSKKTNIFITIFIGNIILWSMFFGFKNMIQLIAIIYCFLFVAILILANVRLTFSRKAQVNFSSLQKLTYLAILILAAQDLYVADISREGYYHLSLLIIVVSINNFFNVMREVQSKKIENSNIKEKLNNENIVVGALSSIHELYKEVIHDLKGPVTALNFLAKSNNIDSDALTHINLRFNEVLSKIERGKHAGSSSDWYMIQHLCEATRSVQAEKQLILQAITLQVEVDSEDIEVFYDPGDFKIILSELIDNSLKHRSIGLKVNIDIKYILVQEALRIIISDNGPGVSAQFLKFLGKKGFSASGSGTGIYSLKKRVECFGGIVSFKNASGLQCCISLKVRSPV